MLVNVGKKPEKLAGFTIANLLFWCRLIAEYELENDQVPRRSKESMWSKSRAITRLRTRIGLPDAGER